MFPLAYVILLLKPGNFKGHSENRCNQGWAKKSVMVILLDGRGSSSRPNTVPRPWVAREMFIYEHTTSEGIEGSVCPDTFMLELTCWSARAHTSMLVTPS